MTPSTLTPAQVAAYQHDGYVVVPQLFSATETTAWKKIAADAIAKRARSKMGVYVWMADVIDGVLREAMAGDRMRVVLKQLIGPNVEFLSAKAVLKDGVTTFGSPWHQDWFYWEGTNKVSVWVALDDATKANGALTVVPGTHHKVYPRKTVAGDTFPEQLAEDISNLPMITADVKAGDAIIFNDLLVHGSHPNTSGQDRWSLIATYRDASQKDVSEVWKTALLMNGESVNGGMREFTPEPAK